VSIPASNEHVVRAGTGASTDPGLVTAITPGSAGWGWTGLEVRDLDPRATRTWRLETDEGGLLPLEGDLTAEITTADGGRHAIDVAGRPSVWSGPADFVYLPLGSTVSVTAGSRGARVALARARAETTREVQVLRAADVAVELRGAGSCSRQVHAYTIGTAIAVDRLLVCEVITPGGNTSSYPPHKHDEHGEHERELEEIYYFEVADTPGGPGVAYHRTYGTPSRPIEVLAEVRTGDVALVPHGYHGPCVALPGADLYYLNVMAGPERDGRWLSVDDPAWAWLRESWESQQVDPRLPFTATHATAASPTDREDRR
jgi:5-deoxy-glucuronate isomerase